MRKFNRVFTIVIDSLGVGCFEDSYKYGDDGANTLGHISERFDGLKIDNLYKLGMCNLTPVKQYAKNENPIGYYTKMKEHSVGKDTMTGHWEMMGLYIDKPFITFTEHGFPQELIDELEKRSGYKFIGNKAASGTEILEELGPRHLKTNELILYTSADSVLQIAACEDTIGLDNLYKVCEIARELTMKPEWMVGRVIARPFKVIDGKFVRTPNRHDYALKPFGRTTLNELKENGFDVISIGKINDIFVTEGITKAIKSKSSVEGMQQTIDVCKSDFEGLCFVNLVDFDALWGHRRNPIGYGEELNRFDVLLGELLETMKEDDLLMITADHGNDPTWTGTDHTREMTPLLVYSKSLKEPKELKQPNTFSVIGATIADNFGIKLPEYGFSYLDDLK